MTPRQASSAGPWLFAGGLFLIAAGAVTGAIVLRRKRRWRRFARPSSPGHSRRPDRPDYSARRPLGSAGSLWSPEGQALISSGTPPPGQPAWPSLPPGRIRAGLRSRAGSAARPAGRSLRASLGHHAVNLAEQLPECARLGSRAPVNITDDGADPRHRDGLPLTCPHSAGRSQNYSDNVRDDHLREMSSFRGIRRTALSLVSYP